MDFFKNKLLTIVLVLCLAFTIFIGLTASRKGNVGAIQNIVGSVIAPVQKYVYIAGQRVSNMFYFVASISSTRKENMQLKSDVDKLNQKLLDYDDYKKENEELNKLLTFKNSHQNLTLKGANVIGKVGENWFDMFVLNVGTSDGVKNGQYVINAEGLIGKIIEVNKNTSKVITLLDSKANIPVQITSIGEIGMLSGYGSSSEGKLCKVDYLSIETKAKEGDTVATSNILSDADNLVPSDIIVGFVQRVEDEKPNLAKAAYIKPAVDFSKIEKVLVIIK